MVDNYEPINVVINDFCVAVHLCVNIFKASVHCISLQLSDERHTDLNRRAGYRDTHLKPTEDWQSATHTVKALCILATLCTLFMTCILSF